MHPSDPEPRTSWRRTPPGLFAVLALILLASAAPPSSVPFIARPATTSTLVYAASVVGDTGCQVGSPSVAIGGAENVQGSLQNNTASPMTVQALVLAGRPPGGTHAGGPFDDFAPTASNLMLAPGASYTLKATRTFASGSPTGSWYCYLTYQSTDGVWHDSADTAFTVGPTPAPTPTPRPTPSPTPTPRTPGNATADLTTKVVDLPSGAESTTISTYGSPVTTDAVARALYGRIVAGQIVRIPLQWNGGTPVSSAGGASHAILGDDWVKAITSMGGRVMIVLGGTTDNNFSASDAAAMVMRYHPYAIVLGNEPGNSGIDVATYTNNIYLPAARAVRAADANVLIAGPAWAWYDSSSLQFFIGHVGGLLDILDYHHYGTGTNAPGDATLMSQTPNWEGEVTQIHGWLAAAGMGRVQVQVGEYNLAWQFTDGRTDYLGGDGRFYNAFNTAWSASVIGHILRAGGRSIAYSQQNGPLGVMVEPGNKDAGHPDGTPMPIYHGIGAFQGEGLHTGFGDALMASSSTNSSLEVYAGSSGNIVLVNKSAASTTAVLDVRGSSDGTKTVWVTQTANPFAAPVQTTTQLIGGRATLVLQPYQVATLVTR
jgi:hypothetical protein